jgi:hypothetical protein
VRGTVVIRSLTDCSYVFDTGIKGAKTDFSWDGRYVAMHAPKPKGGYDILVVDLQERTVRNVTSALAGSSYFPSWTRDGRLSFRYDGSDYRGFMFARDKTTTIESTQPSVERETSSSTLSLTLDAMFYASPINHVVILGGPFLDLGMLYGSYSEKTTGGTSTNGDAKLTAFGLAFGLGVVF